MQGKKLTGFALIRVCWARIKPTVAKIHKGSMLAPCFLEDIGAWPPFQKQLFMIDAFRLCGARNAWFKHAFFLKLKLIYNGGHPCFQDPTQVWLRHEFCAFCRVVFGHERGLLFAAQLHTCCRLLTFGIPTRQISLFSGEFSRPYADK